MPRYKGTRYVTMRKVMEGQSREAENELLSRLAPEEKEKYLNAQAITWFDINELPAKGEMFETAAQVLFPGDSEGLQKIGTLNAKASLTGIYKIFLRIPSTDFILRRVAQVWRSYQDAGNGIVEKKGEHAFFFKILGHPSLDANFREYLCGYIRGVLELTGIKRFEVFHDATDPDAWCWEIRL